MISDKTFLYHWSIVIQGREFTIAVLRDGTMEWQELEAISQAGGDQYISDFVGAIMGDEKAALRATNLIDEFKISTAADETVMEFLSKAGSLDEDTPLPSGLEDQLDEIFMEQFWNYVNSQLPNPLVF